MKKIISFSLWGDNTRYLFGAIQNIELAKIYYPDWICRFYINEFVCPKIIPVDVVLTTTYEIN